MENKLQISGYVLDMMIFHAEKDYPNETCGIVIGPKGIQKAIGVFPVKNIQEEMHSKDPEGYPREAKTAYFMDPKEMKIVQKEAESKGFEVKIYYHSHCDRGVYFSDEDKKRACLWGGPNNPRISFLVVGVDQGKAFSASLFFWDGEENNFRERRLKMDRPIA